MVWVWVVVLVVIIGAIAVVAVGRDDAMADVYDDRPDTTIPTGRPLTAADIRAVRFTTGLRGYRMDEVDALLARLEADLAARGETGSASGSGTATRSNTAASTADESHPTAPTADESYPTTPTDDVPQSNELEAPAPAGDTDDSGRHKAPKASGE
ncbi:MAG: DivIVA domain-containing protein [Nocardioidaceae bacterium]|nr:DivIVA domain-containing protein [Nocardioidaceae bacterium]